MSGIAISLIPMADFIEKIRGVLDFDISSVSDIFFHFDKADEEWSTVPDWEKIPDPELARHIMGTEVAPGTYYIVTDLSYNEDLGVFRIDGAQFFDFVQNHLSLYKECLFNGDTLIFCAAGKMLWLFHHEGVFLRVGLN